MNGKLQFKHMDKLFTKLKELGYEVYDEDLKVTAIKFVGINKVHLSIDKGMDGQLHKGADFNIHLDVGKGRLHKTIQDGQLVQSFLDEIFRKKPLVRK